jgi:tetratricopeptide (TPR) repeat protein
MVSLEAQSAPRYNYSAAARTKFTQKKYDEAIELYRKHLRQSPRDYNAWNQIGAAYYQTGLPRRGLKYLKFVERKTVEKSYNYYYQGLCYSAIGRRKKSLEYFAYSATRYTDEYGSRSTFEMGAVEYNLKHKDKARYWLTMYLHKYGRGVYRVQAQKLLNSLQAGIWLSDVEGIKKPDMEKALFKYNKLSLSPKPHYWFFQGGTKRIDKAGKEPNGPAGGISTNNSSQMAAIVNAGVGIGPVKQGVISAFGGYTYRQNWLTDQDRISTYTEDFLDIQYFPFRGDLLERKHQFYADFRRPINEKFFIGTYAKLQFARIGSEIYPSPESENEELKKVLKISDTTLLIPWIGVSVIPNNRSLFYLYLRKEINEDSPEHSNKSYEFGLSGEDPVISFGASHTLAIPQKKISLNLEVFQYEFIYNDYWLDYTRQGGMLTGEIEVVPRWFVSGFLGMYEDSYLLPRLKQGSCASSVKITNSDTAPTTSSNSPVGCPRTDSGLMQQVSVYWNWTQFTRISGSLLIVQNDNSDLKEFEESKQVLEIRYTMAFPSVKRVSRFIDRFADSAFTKEAE